MSTKPGLLQNLDFKQGSIGMSKSKDRWLARKEAATADPVVGRIEPVESPELTWEQRHKRATFHFPVELLTDLKAVAKNRGVSTSSPVVQAIENELANETR